MKTRFKLIFGFSVIILLFLLEGYLNITNINKLHTSFNLLDEETIPVVHSLQDIKISSLKVVASTMEVAFMEIGNGVNLTEEKEKINQGKTDFEGAFLRYGILVETYFPDETEVKSEIKERWDILTDISDEIVSLKEKGITDKGIIESKDKLEEAEENLLESIDEALQDEEEETKTRGVAVEKIVKNSLINTLIFMFVTIIFSLLIGIIVSKSISKPLKRLVYTTNEVGKGNLDIKTEIKSKDEFGELSSNFDKMTEDLKKSMISINELDKNVKERTKKLQSKNEEMEQFNKLAVGRETSK